MIQAIQKKLNIPVVRQILSGMVYYSGILHLWDLLVNKRRAKIIAFHEICDNDFRGTQWANSRSLFIPAGRFIEILTALKDRYEVVSLSEATEQRRQKALAITFDDGFRGVYRYAYPILKNMGIPATVFLTTGFLDSKRLPWWEILDFQAKRLIALPENKRRRIVSGLSAELKDILSKARSTGQVLESFKTLGARHRNELQLFLKAAFGEPDPPDQRIFLSCDEIREMMQGRITFGAHTVSHPILCWLDDKRLTEELVESMRNILELSGENSCWFAYPDGVFTQREIGAVRSCGFSGAVQTFRRPDIVGPFSIPRVSIKLERILGASGRISRAMLQVELVEFNKRRWRSLLNSMMIVPQKVPKLIS